MRVRIRETATKKRPANLPATPLMQDKVGSAEEVTHSPLAQPTGLSHQFGLVSPRAKLAISQPADPLEQEADRAASQVMQKAIPENDLIPPGVSRHVPRHEIEPAESTIEAESLVRSEIASGGAPLSAMTRREMESMFGHDFSQVRIHADSASAESARSVNALAYTVGSDIVFGAGRYAPGTRDGDRLLAHELTHVVQQTQSRDSASEGPLTLSRQFEVPAKVPKLDAPAEREQEKFAETDKERARATVIAPLRAAAARLGAEEKADVVSVLRHLRPMRAAAAGVKWPESALPEVAKLMDDLDSYRTLLDSIKLSDRQAVGAARRHWLEARRELAAARKALNAARPDSKKTPDAQEREGLSNDINAIAALSAQIDATIQDLIKAPRNQEGFKAVDETATQLLHQIATVQPPEAQLEMARVMSSVSDGIATITPLVLGKEETLKTAQKGLTEIADRLAALVGDTAPATDKDPGKDDEEENQPHTPAPSPNPLPPPPPPPLPPSPKGGS